LFMIGFNVTKEKLKEIDMAKLYAWQDFFSLV
jgi:hypothetical protein